MRHTILSKVLAGLAALALPLTAAVVAPPTASASSAVRAVQADWAAWTAYAAGARVTYNGVEYECLQAHTSQPGWEPRTCRPCGRSPPAAAPTPPRPACPATCAPRA
ncbi:carbohydrate-binding protein [Nonomuraea thailandensis]